MRNLELSSIDRIDEHASVFTQGFDGSSAWGRKGEQPANDMRGLHLAEGLREAELLPAVAFAGSKAKPEVIATGKIGGHPVVEVGLGTTDDSKDRLYFDTASGMLVRRAFQVLTPLGAIPFQIDYSDWMISSGVKIPATASWKQSGESWILKLDEVKPAGTLADGAFSKPK